MLTLFRRVLCWMRIARDPQILERLAVRMASMSLADISVLDGAIKQSKSVMGTALGSANDQLWSEMEKLGLLMRKRKSITADSHTVDILTYEPQPWGAEIIRRLIEQSHARRKTMFEQVQPVLEVLNRLHPQFVQQIIEPIKAAGGSPAAAIVLLSSVTTTILNEHALPEARQQLYDQLCSHVKQGLKAD